MRSIAKEKYTYRIEFMQQIPLSSGRAYIWNKEFQAEFSRKFT